MRKSLAMAAALAAVMPIAVQNQSRAPVTQGEPFGGSGRLYPKHRQPRTPQPQPRPLAELPYHGARIEGEGRTRSTEEAGEAAVKNRVSGGVIPT